MSPSRSRKSQSRFNPFLAGLLVVLAIVGVVFTLDFTGVTNTGLSKLFKEREVRANTNLVAVVLPTRMLPPGHEVSRADLWDAQAKAVRTVSMDKQVVQDGHFATGLNLVAGRVLARPKAPFEPFQPDDFLPKGSPKGLVGLVPEGMRLVPVSATNIKGLDALMFQDRFDLYVTDSANASMVAAAKKVLDAREFVSDADRMRFARAEKALKQRLMVQGGVVLRAADPNAKGKDKEVALALHPDDVEGLMAAIESESTIFCIARTPGDATQRVAVVVPDPMEEFSWLYENRQDAEFFNGNERTVISVPRVQ